MDALWSETCWSTFKYFIILVVSIYYILCISWMIIKCLMYQTNEQFVFWRVRKTAKSDCKLGICLSVSTWLSVCMNQLVFHWTDFHKIRHLSIFRKSVDKFEVSLKCDMNSGTVQEDTWTSVLISRRILLRLRNVSDKSCRDKSKCIFTFNNFSLKLCPSQYSVENMVQPDRTQMTIQYGTCALHAG